MAIYLFFSVGGGLIMSGILTLPDILEQPLLCMQILQPIQNVLKVCKKGQGI